MSVADHASPRGEELLAVCRRVRILGMATVGHGDVLKVRRCYLPGRSDPVQQAIHAATAVASFAHDYGVRHVAIEPQSNLADYLVDMNLKVTRFSISMTKQVLKPGAEEMSHADLLHHLLDRYPKLTRFVNVLPVSGRVAMTERRRTVVLLAAALGIAAYREGHANNSVASHRCEDK
jgi:hypothetical protein